ncbi:MULTISPECIES: pyrroloquinoline quinone biosynthesis protein PqqB [unclassified Pseudomonas]|uniref:pyrroloquinoline quinone biosynthesis protein PqqB n=1 Tax=unclassified Pseudomonas TaxID=196821 RepID=UPI000A0DEA47|nr:MULTISPECIES: pyrroloquinoline quinone biosynthesis protein PqqB [unclassified Pseudomonas]SMF47712.1 pyrroloquinoline quinone biosynthesis protein B [Pseudomonas sp. LAIL14HWK12:I11]SMR73786.1 pyrroloquinoline quinone biosynthesis protein B [Pseudomonas sp. LAIL14HWK12:I10]SOD06053.1 pyrroloquinoline quinone biosynthesis protein B [Pseudomonas sp. LAIL14HWK12:I8]
MHIRVLGSAAGGGFPQWNCNCRQCTGVRNGSLRAQRRTQSSIAVSDDGEQWILCNASPDIRAQLESFPALQPARRLRDTAIGAVVLLDSQIDHCTGLLSLREGCPHTVWCTERVHEDLSSGFPLFTLLKHWNGGLQWQCIGLDREPFRIAACPNLQFRAVPLLSNAPPYSPNRGNPQSGDTIGLLIEDRRSGASVFYAPGLGQVDAEVASWMRHADCLLLDGTLWRDDEMRVCEVGQSLGSEMGHLAQSGPGGMLEVLEGFSRQRKILIHINNTNPILDEDSAERALLDRRRIEVAYDGLSITL